MQALNPKFPLHTAESQLLVETHGLQMNGDWPGFHATTQTYELFVSECFHGTLFINMLKALDPYFQRKVSSYTGRSVRADCRKLAGRRASYGCLG